MAHEACDCYRCDEQTKEIVTGCLAEATSIFAKHEKIPKDELIEMITNLPTEIKEFVMLLAYQLWHATGKKDSFYDSAPADNDSDWN